MVESKVGALCVCAPAVSFCEVSDAVEDILEAVAEVVDDDDVEAFFEEFEGCVRAYVAKATDNHDIVSTIIGVVVVVV